MNLFRIWFFQTGMLVGMLFCAGKLISCSDKEQPPEQIIMTSVSINPAVTHQEMIGFGGAITWYNTWMTNSSKKNLMADYLFNDLGADIVRFKNWYYPDHYPDDKSTASMSDDGSKAAFESTNELHQLAISANPEIKTLLSSWGPPQALKSNGSTREGTLKKNASQEFMYKEFGTYWNDVLDHLTFTPDYISIQNEPSYINSGWTTCEWAPAETASLAGYDQAFEAVADQLALRANPPIMVGPESANIGWSPNGNTFSIFADAIKDHPSLGVYAYHPYNFNSSTQITETTEQLNMVKSYSGKPNLMTEFSDNFDWMKTALFINNTLTEGNTSGYIYWKMIWATPTGSAKDVAMISVNSSGDFTITPYYYLIKHFAKYIDAGYTRVDVSSPEPSLSISAFVNPAGNSATVVIINPLSIRVKASLSVAGKTISGLMGYRSQESIVYRILESPDAEEGIELSPKSITTVVLDIN